MHAEVGAAAGGHHKQEGPRRIAAQLAKERKAAALVTGDSLGHIFGRLFRSVAVKRGGRWRDHRQVLGGILWVARTGSSWREMPEEFGAWQMVYDRFAQPRDIGVFAALMVLREQLDAEQIRLCCNGAT